MWSDQFEQVATLMAARPNNEAHFLVAIESTGDVSSALVRRGVLIAVC